MSQLWLVRHGQTDWNVEGRYQGQSDIPLNETGRAQARALAEQWAGQKFEALYSSDLKRAYETACILGARLNLKVQVDPSLREICQGEWEGLQVQCIAQRYQAEVTRMHGNRQDFRAPGGESVTEVGQRMAQAADRIAQTHPHGGVLIVSHGMSVSTLYCLSQAISLAEAYLHIPENGQPVRVEWGGSL